ncbi:hypothetical protein M9Y10_005409 [Tritrichomonas musculus]|uniref:C2 NT-type domain-containing protein n=1 Tax=Tritrichomonas musculus TaxID=1915356 RepID=A0ABR2JL24_9EUKA
MSLFNEKRHALVILTIHNLNLPEPITDSSFQIKWKRGKSKGFTEKMFPQENTVHFEKRFRFKSHFLFLKDRCRTKILSLNVLRFKEKSLLKKPKIYGKLVVDLSMYQKTDSPLTSTYTLESKHSKKATIMITIQVKFVGSKKNIPTSMDTDNTQTISSLNTADILSSDHVSSWDVSTIINPNDSNLISSQSERIKSSRLSDENKKNESHQALQSCIADDEQRLQNMKRRKSVNHARKAASILIPPEPENQTEILQSKLTNFFAPSNPKIGDQKTFRKSKKMSDMYLSYQVSLGLLKSTLNHAWCDSPVPIIVENVDTNQQNEKMTDDEKKHQINNTTNSQNAVVKKENQTKNIKNVQNNGTKKNQINDEKEDSSDSYEEEDEEEDSNEVENKKDEIPLYTLVSYPKPSSAIFAVILHTQFLQKNVYGGVYFDSLVDSFFKTIESHKFVNGCTPVDVFYVFTHLLALLEKETVRKDSSFYKKENENKDNDNTPNDNKNNNNYTGHLASTISNFELHEVDKDRYFMFYNRLANITIDSFSHLCEHLVEGFNPYITDIFNPGNDPNNIIEGFVKCFSFISAKKSVEKEILIIAEDYINLIIDAILVDRLIKERKLCTLSNAIQWNYLITSLEAEVPICKLTLFKEIGSVIMMSKNICQSPIECDEIAPHLPKLIVYTILRNLTTCEYMPELPDPSSFFRFYKNDIASMSLDYMLTTSDNYLTTSDRMTVDEINEKNIVLPTEFKAPKFDRFEDIIASINTSNWKDIHFTEKEQMDFSFVETIFNNSSD